MAESSRDRGAVPRGLEGADAGFLRALLPRHAQRRADRAGVGGAGLMSSARDNKRCHARVSGHPVNTGRATLQRSRNRNLDNRVRCLLGSGSRDPGRTPGRFGRNDSRGCFDMIGQPLTRGHMRSPCLSGGGSAPRSWHDCSITSLVWLNQSQSLCLFSRSRIYPTSADSTCRTRVNPSSGGRESTELADNSSAQNSKFDSRFNDSGH